MNLNHLKKDKTKDISLIKQKMKTIRLNEIKGSEDYYDPRNNYTEDNYYKVHGYYSNFSDFY